jgi:hypothetical protein
MAYPWLFSFVIVCLLCRKAFLMISSKLQFFNKFSSKAVANSSVPLLPGSPGSSVISPTVSGPDIIRFKAVKRKGKKYSLSGFGNGGSGGGGNLPPNSSPNGYETFPKNALMTSSASTLKGILCPDDHVNLFTVYGNILTSESNETLSVKYDSAQKETEFKEYPLDEGLLSLLENSARFWYSNTSKKLPSMLSLHAPSRSSTWELARHLAGKIGQSNLILVPFVLFHELFQTCTLASMSLNDSSKKSPFSFSNNSSQLAANTSRSAIQVIQYLFTCAEDMGLHHGGRVTILVDGLEEFLQNRKGCEGVLKEIALWMASLDCSEFKKSIILGGRSINFIDEDSPTLKNEANEEESEPPQDEDATNNGPTHNNNNSIVSFNNSANNGSKSGSAFQVITDFLLNASVSKPPSGTNTGVATFTNVRLEGPILRLFVNGPKNDKRKLLKYSQKMSEDRKKDIFDGNLFLLRSVARNRWKIELDLGLGGKRYTYPSCNANLWSMLSNSGRGILTKRRLQRDEVNEIFMYTLGKLVNESTKKIEGSQLAEAVENVTSLRHDPTRFSSDDLAHLLSERQITMNSLSKYEKRFINCISTATTQTSFNDISLPNGTVETLRSLTSLPLSHPELFTRGVLKNSLTGVLLFGPPGTGKTMLARAVAQESGAAFLAINMSNIFDMWVGEGEKNVKVKNVFDLYSFTFI